MFERLSKLMSGWNPNNPSSVASVPTGNQPTDAFMNNTAYLNNTATKASTLGAALDTTTTTPGTWDTLAGYTDNKTGIQHNGLIPTGVQSLSGLMSMWNGYQATQLAQKQYELSKQAFEKNYAASVAAYNNGLTNQANRMAARGESAMNGMTADEYAAKYGLSN